MSDRLDRRRFLAASVAGAAVIAFDPLRGGWVTAAQAAASGGGAPRGAVAVPHLDGELTTDPAALAAAAAEVEDAGGVRVLPALAGVGAPWWESEARAVVAGLTSGTRPAHIARASLEAIAWRVADVVGVVRETVPVEVLRVDGGLTRDSTLLQLQADAAGVPVQRGAVDATVAGAAALGAVGAGIWGSTLEIAERVPAGERTEPRRDAAWREAAHADWRRFVKRAVAL